MGSDAYISGLLTKTSPISKGKHLLWVHTPPGGNRTMPKSPFFHFFMDPKCGLCAVWGVLVYEHGWFLRLMRSRIM